MKPASDSLPARPLLTLEQRQQAFRDLIHESTPIIRRSQEIGIEQSQLGFEINLEIAQRRFPLAEVSEAGPIPNRDQRDEYIPHLPMDCIASPHDLPKRPRGEPSPKWVISVLTPRDDGKAAETICQYLIDAKVEPSEILIQRGAFRVLLVR